MPLSINVGLSRKASRDYQSSGQSINVTAELDHSLLARPDELQREISSLYQQAQIALDNACDEPASASRSTVQTNGRSRLTAGNATVRTHPSNGNGNGDAPGMTASQKRAIYAIAQRHGLDPQVECEDEFGCRLDDLTVRQASSFIDHLKNLPGSNGSRKAGVR